MPRPDDHTYWESVHNTHLGGRAFILATGPSLTQLDISPLADEFTVGVNHLRRYQGLSFHPNAWAACEYDDLYKIADDLVDLPEPKWFAHPVWHTYNPINPSFNPDDTWVWIHTDSHMNFAGDEEKWKGKIDLLGLGDVFWRVAVGHSPVLEPAIPVLAWMGFREIYLLGVDHTPDNHAYAADGKRNQRIEAATKALASMVPELEAHGVVVRNCSPGSRAPVPYVDLEEVIGVPR
jgi:hypothetical protein